MYKDLINNVCLSCIQTQHKYVCGMIYVLLVFRHYKNKILLSHAESDIKMAESENFTEHHRLIRNIIISIIRNIIISNLCTVYSSYSTNWRHLCQLVGGWNRVVALSQQDPNILAVPSTSTRTRRRQVLIWTTPLGIDFPGLGCLRWGALKVITYYVMYCGTARYRRMFLTNLLVPKSLLAF